MTARHGGYHVRPDALLPVPQFRACKDRTGERYGRLVAVRRVMSVPGVVWLCRCDCGRWPEVPSARLAYRKSCGCLAVEAALRREAARRR